MTEALAAVRDLERIGRIRGGLAATTDGERDRELGIRDGATTRALVRDREPPRAHLDAHAALSPQNPGCQVSVKHYSRFVSDRRRFAIEREWLSRGGREFDEQPAL